MIRDVSATPKIADILASPLTFPVVQSAIGAALGVAAHKFVWPLTERIMKLLSPSTILSGPFGSLSLTAKILKAPLVCVLGPVIEEVVFRGNLQEILKGKFASFFVGQGFSNSAALKAARVASVFFTAIIFGLAHFANALRYWCNPMFFLPQVVATTILGFMFGAAKELTGELHMSTAMHASHNAVVWTLS